MEASLQVVQQHNQVHDADNDNNKQVQETRTQKLYTTYIGVSFAVLLSLLPKNAYSMQSQNKHLLNRLRKAEDELYELRSRRQEDSKANARVVEIFATHRNAWQQEERRLLRRLDDSSEEISRLRSRIAEIESHEAQLIADADELRRQIGERDELLNFMSRHQSSDNGVGDEGNVGLMFSHLGSNDFGGRTFDGFDSNCLSASDSSKFWGETSPPNLWQDIQYESIEPTHHVKHFAVRRESPWKVDGESSGVQPMLKLLEEELLNFEKVCNNSSAKVVSSMRKQAKRYQDLAGKIDDLCRRMQASDPIEPTLSSEFRSQRQTEFLLDAFQLQQRASETGKKLMSLQTEIYTNCIWNDLGVETKTSMRKSLDNIRTNFKEVQRNLEIWLARIMGDLEGILARDGASRSRDYYFPRYPFVNSYS